MRPRKLREYHFERLAVHVGGCDQLVLLRVKGNFFGLPEHFLRANSLQIRKEAVAKVSTRWPGGRALPLKAIQATERELDIAESCRTYGARRLSKADQNPDGFAFGTGLVGPWQAAQSLGVGL